MAKVSVLTYHAVVPDASAEIPGSDPFYQISEAAFEAQLALLKERGLRVLGLTDLQSFLQGEDPRDGVLLTFDDGHRSHVENVLPLLKRYGYTAVFFVSPALIGTEGYLRWEQVITLKQQGMEIGGHGYSHIPLTSLPATELWEDLQTCYQTLDKHLGEAPRSFSLPGGYGDPTVGRAVVATGFEFLFSSEGRLLGTASDPANLGRFVIRQGSSLKEFENFVLGRPVAIFCFRLNQTAIRVLKRAIPHKAYEKLKRAISGRNKPCD